MALVITGTILALLNLGGVLSDFGIYFIMLREISVPNAPQAEIIGTAMALRMVSTFTILIAEPVKLWHYGRDGRAASSGFHLGR